jgi:hypothetical protein
MLATMKPVRGVITHPRLPNGVPDLESLGDTLQVELVWDVDGTAALRNVKSGQQITVEELPPSAHLRLTEPPGDDDGERLLDDIIAEGLPVASPLSGSA